MSTPSRTRLVAAPLALLSLALFALYVALGTFVSSRPPLAPDRAAATALFDHGAAIAWILTESCFFPVLLTVAIALIAAAWLVPALRARVAFAVLSNLGVWQLSDALKLVFRRARPPHWIVHHETSYSYSSGHATLSLVVYGLWAFFIWRSELPKPVRLVASGALVLWTLGVGWSRLSLGAHYLSDVIGGYLLTAAWLTAGFALCARLGVRLTSRHRAIASEAR